MFLLKEGYSSDTLSIHFQGPYKMDTVELYVNNKLVYQGIIKTDVISGLAKMVEVPKPRTRKILVIVRINKHIEGIVISRRVNCLAIWGHENIHFITSRKLLMYL
ncbi:MAG: hypothetical protein RMJ53_07685 [Chitinophagales bacterium]|nr:hypothetical protein [Chitinophagales bacterium]